MDYKPHFPNCKITVMKTLYHEDLAEAYRHPAAHKGPCHLFKEGQEFTAEFLASPPEGFLCDWAWNDLHKILLAMMTRGKFGNWMKDENTFITCCTDGVKPVVFKIERLETG